METIPRGLSSRTGGPTKQGTTPRYARATIESTLKDVRREALAPVFGTIGISSRDAGGMETIMHDLNALKKQNPLLQFPPSASSKRMEPQTATLDEVGRLGADDLLNLSGNKRSERSVPGMLERMRAAGRSAADKHLMQTTDIPSHERRTMQTDQQYGRNEPVHSATSLSHTLKHKSSRGQRNLASQHDEIGGGAIMSSF